MGPLADQTAAHAEAHHAEPDEAYVTRLHVDDAGLAHRIPPATTRLPARNAAALGKAARYRRLPAPGCPRTGAHRAELGESERFAAAAGFADSGLTTHHDQYLFTAQRYAEDVAGQAHRRGMPDA